MWRRRWLIWAAINPPEKEKEGKINQSINAVDPPEKTTPMLSIDKKRKKRPFESGTKIGYKNWVQKSGTKI